MYRRQERSGPIQLEVEDRSERFTTLFQAISGAMFAPVSESASITTTERVSNTLQLQVREGGDGIRFLEKQLGNKCVEVREIRGSEVSEETRNFIRGVRESYPKMWGGNPYANEALLWDEVDELSTTTHYIAVVTDDDLSQTIITMRKTRVPLWDEDAHIPGDLAYYQIKDLYDPDLEQPAVPMVDVVREFVEQKILKRELVVEDPSLPIAVISRAASQVLPSPNAESKKDKQEVSERSAIAFAAIQYLATENDPHALWFCQLNKQLQQIAFRLRDVVGTDIFLDFQTTAETLGLRKGLSIFLDRNNKEVLELMIDYLGYWLKGEDVKRILEDTAAEGILLADDLRPGYLRAIGKNGQREDVDVYQMIEILTQAKNRKFLTPLIKGEEVDFPYLNRLSEDNHRLEVGALLLERFLNVAADGPFSSSFTPGQWRKSAIEMLAAAQQKYSR